MPLSTAGLEKKEVIYGK